MTKQNNISIPLYLMGGSLLLLVVFIFLWLNRVYKDEYQTLKREADFLFVNSIRDYEDELFRNTATQPVVIRLSDTSDIDEFQNTGRAASLVDSIIVTSLIKADSFPFYPDTFPRNNHVSVKVVKNWPCLSCPDSLSKTDDSKKTRIRRDAPNENEFYGSISLYLELMQDSASIDLSSSGSLKEVIHDQFWTSAQETDATFPSNFEVVILTDSLPRTSEFQVFQSKHYKDLLTGEALTVEFADYKGFLIKRMIPEILFSILLLGITALAFFFIYRSLQRQRRLTELKNDLISNITHELKTPITTVGVAIEALSNFDAKDNPVRTQEYLDISKLELNRLSILVDKVLKMSLFEEKEPTLRLETIPFNTLVDSVLNSMKLQFEKYSAEVNFETTGDNFIVKGDKVHLTNVVYNLLENALKYTRETPKIDIRITGNNDTIKFEISDNGIGIPEPYLEKVFDKFFRVPNGDKHNVKGHGLGLSYVASVVKQHGGKIKASNKQEGGVCFELLLPAAK